MMKKTLVILVLVLCAALTFGCAKKEVFDTLPPTTDNTSSVQNEQNLFGDTIVGGNDFNDGSYDPASEEDNDYEPVDEVYMGSTENNTTPAPTIQSAYTGATPVIIDPIDKPTPTPLPTLSFSYTTYEAPNLHMTFEAPVGWSVDDSQADTYTLTNPDQSVDYAASLTVRVIPVNKSYTKTEVTKELKGILETLGGNGTLKNFEKSQTAERPFLGSTGVYANYKAVSSEGALIAGRIIVVCVDKTLYTLHVSYPRGYTQTYVDNVYNKFRHSVKLQ